MTQRFDLAVIGLGLIGSGATRHAAVSNELTVVGIGPGEPASFDDYDGPFASHYDSGRITRRLDAKREWAVLASRSIEQYRFIEASSGIAFHEPCGLMFVRNDQTGIANQREVADQLEIPVTIEPAEQRRASMPQLHFPDEYTTLYEPGPAGFIDPRRLVAAQQHAARAAGATVLNDVVDALEIVDDSFQLTLRSDQRMSAQRVIVATGAYGNTLLPENDHLAAAVRPEAVVKGEVSEATAQTLDIPSFIYLLDNEFFDDVYVVPPTQYPDGRWYIKIGGSRAGAVAAASGEDLTAWMQGADADEQIAPMRDVLTSVLPDVDFLSWSAKPCLITDTESGLPFVDIIAPGLTVAFGGNGHAAKSSDAIGQLAARLAIEGRWTDLELDAEKFRCHRGVYHPPDGSRHGT